MLAHLAVLALVTARTHNSQPAVPFEPDRPVISSGEAEPEPGPWVPDPPDRPRTAVGGTASPLVVYAMGLAGLGAIRRLRCQPVTLPSARSVGCASGFAALGFPLGACAGLCAGQIGWGVPAADAQPLALAVGMLFAVAGATAGCVYARHAAPGSGGNPGPAA